MIRGLPALPLAIVLSAAVPATAAEGDPQASPARAEFDVEVQSKIAPPRPVHGFAALDRPTGMAEFGFGWLTLPGATICIGLTSGCEQGDTSFILEAWQLYRANTRIAVGAGLTLGLLTTTDIELEERDHSRGYFLFEGIGRYYPYVGENFEAWGGATAGLVVVSDRFEPIDTSFSGDRPLVGKRGVTIRSEGLALGVAAGAAFALAPQWSLGGMLRYGAWFLPEEPELSPFQDQASLKGHITVISIGLDVAYRIPL